MQIPVWGTADPGEQIVVRIASSEEKTIANADVCWKVELSQIAAGGPYTLKIEGNSGIIEFNDVLIGDVWFASGQSNMEHPMKGWEWIPHSAVNRSEDEIADSNYPKIRLFSVHKYPSPVEQKDLQEGKWEVTCPQSVAGFSSTAWFFGKELYLKLKVPIGIINCSWGGTPIQPWMSRESLEHFKDSVNLPVIPAKFDQKEWLEKVAESIEKNRVRRNQVSYPKLGLPEEINKPGFDDLSWKLVDLLDETNNFGNIVWLRKKIIVPEMFAWRQLELSLGFLNRQSQVFLNGKELGYYLYSQPVKIEIPRALVRSGENILTIRLSQPFGGSQVLGSPEQFFASNTDHSFWCNIAEGWKANDQLEPIIPTVESY